MAFDLRKLLVDVFDPQGGEVVLVGCDVPTPGVPDTPRWQERRAMAAEWRAAFAALGSERGFITLPLLTYAATGANNADLPASADLGGRQVALVETLLGSTLTAFLTQFSATAPLDGLCHRKEDFRAASMPGIEKRMEKTALAADYREVARRCQILERVLAGAERLEVEFSTGHRCTFDLRFRKPEVDDGFLPRFKPGDRVINLPSGETFIVPYEGERPETPSTTHGELPLQVADELVVLTVEGNRIVSVTGSGPAAERMRTLFAEDPARTNVAEVAFGCNEWAEVTGVVLEDEKAGFHWAYGRSDHLGGVVGVKDFLSPATVIHQDIVYARGNPIQARHVTVYGREGAVPVIRDCRYLVF
jgi:hypothetical protein